MNIDEDPTRVLSELDRLSGGRLERREDLGVLLGLGLPPERRPVLDELAFSAKFLARARGMMERIGPGGQGYDKLAAEFSRHLEQASFLLRSLLMHAPQEVREQFTSGYLAASPPALRNMLALCGDLGWYKNLLIDSGERRSRSAS
jgi:hypothetical protein